MRRLFLRLGHKASRIQHIGCFLRIAQFVIDHIWGTPCSTSRHASFLVHTIAFRREIEYRVSSAESLQRIRE